MRIIGVIDLVNSRAVAARGGVRSEYQPLRSALLRADQVGDAAALARAYRVRADLSEIYVADLNAIAGEPLQDLTAIQGAGLPLLVDAGVRTVSGARMVVARGAAARVRVRVRVVVGLETLRSFGELAEIVAAVGTEAAVFSLDLRAGCPILAADAAPVLRELSPVTLAERAVEAGVGALILIDVARVGMRNGVDWELVKQLRSHIRSVELLVGGGVRAGEAERSDLDQLAKLDVDGVLIGSALHAGWLPPPLLGTVLRGQVQ